MQRVDRSPDGVLALSVRLPGKTVLLGLVGSPGSVAVGDLVPGRSRSSGAPGRPADSELLRWRKELEGARVLSISRRADGGWLRVSMVRGGERRSVVVTRAGAALVVGAPQGDDEPTGAALVVHEADAPAMAEEVDRAIDAVRAKRLSDDRRALVVAIDRAMQKLERRAEAVRGDMAKMAKADEWTHVATLLAAVAHQVPRGAREVVVDDWSTGEPVPVRVALDPARGAREQSQALFHRAKRLKRGAAIASARLEETRRALDALVGIRALASEAASTEALEVVAKRASAAGARAAPTGRAGRRAPAADERVPYRVFRAGERTILVGRGAEDNDALTTKIARPHDLWLHAKGVTGAHVVVPLQKSEACPPQLLADAAHLAAHFSDARGESVVEVAYAPRRYVRKPRGAAAGAVSIERERVIVLRVESERLRRLLADAEEPRG